MKESLKNGAFYYFASRLVFFQEEKSCNGAQESIGETITIDPTSMYYEDIAETAHSLHYLAFLFSSGREVEAGGGTAGGPRIVPSGLGAGIGGIGES